MTYIGGRMAENDKSYPKIAASNWFKVRELFKKKLPALVTPTYLASSLEMSEDSARSNIINPFKNIGLLNEQGEPTGLAKQWRDHADYPAVCKLLIEQIYPQELRDLYHEESADVRQVSSWFMRTTSCGQAAGSMYARFYKMLLNADLSLSADKLAKKVSKTNGTPAKQAKPAKQFQNPKPTTPAEPIDTEFGQGEESTSPKTRDREGDAGIQLHVNIQLHISPESTAEQIDKIFESMARHVREIKA